MPPAPPTLPLNNQNALNAAQASSAAITDPNNPLGASQQANLQPIHDITYNNLKTGAIAGGAVGEAQAQVAAAKEQKAYADKLAADKADPNKYQRVPKSDGGYAFIGPDGQEVSAADYARIAGTNEAKVLQDSKNPIDQAFIEDYKNLEQYFNDKLSSKYDPKAAARAKATEEEVGKETGINLATMNHQDVVNQFMQAYPTVYGLKTTGPQGINALLPNQSALDTATAGGASTPGN